jgi:holo-[acyl-carrier protein] synthase
MVYGIGCDLCEIARLERSISGAHGETFLRRVYGAQEREALGTLRGAHRAASAAADFAAKEAFLKAAHTGLDGTFALEEIEAVRLPTGAPEYRFSGRAAAWMQQNGLTAHLSISHENGLAMAFCVLETQREK